MLPKNIQWLLLCLLLALYGLLISQPINLLTADLGRHIKNGEYILKDIAVFYTNFYSYTHTDFPFINHHWGSGVIFFIIQNLFGFVGQSLLFVLVSLCTYFIFFKVAQRYSNFELTFLSFLFITPLIAARTEIRPEVFSYLFISIYLFFCINFLKDKISSKYLWLIPIINLLWVNIHIYYVFGLFILAIFLMELILTKYLYQTDHALLKIKQLSLIFILSIATSLINPNLLDGALYPLKIYENYGYTLLENQSVLSIDKLVPNYPSTPYFKMTFLLLIVTFITYLFSHLKRKSLPSLSLILLGVLFSYLGLSAIRNFTIFGLFTSTLIPIFAYSIKKSISQEYKIYYFTFTIFISITLWLIFGPLFWLRLTTIRWGEDTNVLASSNFFKQHQVKGPIFNNYDIGGYLIYTLYPSEKVFVDNRPEAYPYEFLQQVYIPMQEDTNLWKKYSFKYNFNSVFFYRHDLTPWGQSFLINLIKDPEWIPVFVDEYAIIFVRNNDQNKQLIQDYKLPKNIFQVKQFP